MKLKGLFTPFKVGLFVLAAIGAFVAFYSFVHKGGLSKEDSVDVFAIFHDASGLEKKTQVLIAGIPVGEVTSVALYQGQFARIGLRILKSVHLRTDAAITKRSASILGEYVLDIYAGSEQTPLMPDGGQILHVFDEQGMQQIFQALGKITDDIQAVTKELRNVMAGQQGSIQQIVKNLSDVSSTLDRTVAINGERLDQTLANFQRLSAQLVALTSAQKGNVGEIVENVRVASGEARQALATLDQILGANKGNLAENFAGLKSTLGRLDDSLHNVQDITKKIDQGDGAIGRLVSDKALGDKLDRTLTSTSQFVDRLVGMQTEVSMDVDYMFGEAASKGYLNLKLSPKPDKYYLVQVVDDSRGTPAFAVTQTTPANPNFQEPAQEITTTTRSFKFSGEFAKIIEPATFRIGIIESTAGGGVDLALFGDNLRFTTDLFDFNDFYQPLPRVRSYLTARFLDHFEVRGGVDDMLNCDNYSGFRMNCAQRNLVASEGRGYTLGGREMFLGGALTFTDDDLKAVLAAAPVPK
ncbi:MAG: MlaD family protein [Deltaproteobacteria bacterium]